MKPLSASALCFRIALAAVLLAAAPAAAVNRIHLVGDSVLLGGRKALGKVTRSVPHRVQREIPEMVVTAYGRGGWSVSAHKGAAVAPFHADGLVAQLLPRDVVVLMLGVNDFSSSAPLEGFEGVYRHLLEWIKPLEVQILCVTPISVSKEEVKNAQGLLLEDYRNSIRRLCGKAGAKVIEGRQLLQYEPDLYMDAVHPTGRGALRFGRRLAAAIRANVAELRGGAPEADAPSEGGVPTPGGADYRVPWDD